MEHDIPTSKIGIKEIMMITFNQQESSSVLELAVTGKLTHEVYEVFRPKVEEMVRKHGKIRLLFDIAEIHGWEIPTLWEQTKCAAGSFADISRIAIVGNRAWEKAMSPFCRPFTRAEIRHFNKFENLQARSWLEQPKKEMLSNAPPSVDLRM